MNYSELERITSIALVIGIIFLFSMYITLRMYFNMKPTEPITLKLIHIDEDNNNNYITE